MWDHRIGSSCPLNSLAYQLEFNLRSAKVQGAIEAKSLGLKIKGHHTSIAPAASLIIMIRNIHIDIY